ncbi:stage III sporulation protein AF [Paenibacillus uliginis N3/975]|uniref:Stage III sporulation protein AF n=1 Tax=Paenibacillus uliginis N3/975 TaxID=1313296 RepID=A0A1X7HJ85_9BACL|nr:stage III sporulation protein AF [Paenibacillus uliginis]SMF87663.1 stage III sporulation protein AF [Paenibacillus uliginis N3/975]
MEWLSGWLKSVIMVVMFAAFVDLILPSKTMQRYARLVLSMLILLALLRPLISFLTEPPEKQLALDLERVESNKSIPKEAELEHILAQAEKLKNVQQKQSLQWAGEEIARQMKDQITAEIGEPVEEVKVVLAAPREGSAVSAVIASVEVRLRDPVKPEAVKNPSVEGTEPVKPVDTIRVNVEINRNGSKDDKTRDEDSLEADAALEAREAPVRDLLRSRWDLKPDQISIHSSGSETQTKL